jgi:hypothetical protein
LAEIIKREPSQPRYMTSPDTTPPKIALQDMDIFTVCAIAIVVVLLITVVVMGGWLR